MDIRKRIKTITIAIFVLAVLAGFLDYSKAWNKSVDWLNAKKNEVGFLKRTSNIPQFFNLPFKLGLDLRGGTHLIYEADLSRIGVGKPDEAMAGVRDVIERRVNLFGVTEPVVQTEKVGNHHRLIVELAGVKDVNEAIKMIGETPSLDFREARSEDETNKILAAQKAGDSAALSEDPYFGSPTELTGKYLTKSQVELDPNTGRPGISLEFNGDGANLFEQITGRNVGKRLAIYLDGTPISAPVVQEAISGGQARITGDFTIDEAKTLVQRLNAGALPVPIKLINQQTVGASLGESSLEQSLRAGLVGLLAVALFMISWYRWPGFVSVVALLIYILVVLAIFKLISVTLTLAGIAGFILSVGMAVDANILIFERTKEELRTGKSLVGAVEEGFKRAWTSIRDSNISSLITCAILFWLGTSIIKGFALTLAIGILISMFSAITVTRTFLLWFVSGKFEKWEWMWR
ncbi:MAG: protein translocase subunit SecD [Candidatus Portnoybacteria bacterium]|nr:protein translocase subunit SecD [Candidatus Portnoybacteria bacterium]